jgi:hypothetical protein
MATRVSGRRSFCSSREAGSGPGLLPVRLPLLSPGRHARDRRRATGPVLARALLLARGNAGCRGSSREYRANFTSLFAKKVQGGRAGQSVNSFGISVMARGPIGVDTGRVSCCRSEAVFCRSAELFCSPARLRSGRGLAPCLPPLSEFKLLRVGRSRRNQYLVNGVSFPK